jgi:hypothetical protein
VQYSIGTPRLWRQTGISRGLTADEQPDEAKSIMRKLHRLPGGFFPTRA